MNRTLKHFISYSLPSTIIIIGVLSVASFPNIKFPIIYTLDNTALKWFFSAFALFVFFYSKKFFFNEEDKKHIQIITLYLIWNYICIIRGVFVAEGYWEWKGLINNVLGLLLPIVAFSATNKAIVRSVLSFFIKYGLPLFIILFFLIQTDAYGFYLMPLSFLILFLPALEKRQIIVIFIFIAIIFLSDLGARSNVIKFATPLLMLIFYYYRDVISQKILNYIRIAFIIAPFVLFSLAVTEVFNVFNMNEYMGEMTSIGVDEEGKRDVVDLSQDTRTFIYVEVIESAINNNYWIFGRTPARGNDSEFFGHLEYELTRRDERLGNEVGVLNVFTWLGIIGVILYFIIFYKASYLAVNYSNNTFSKLLGIYIAFRWLYSWVEDVNNFSLNYFMLWIMIGLCFSNSFRSMSNYEVTIWIRSIFDKRYVNFEENLKKESNERNNNRNIVNLS